MATHPSYHALLRNLQYLDKLIDSFDISQIDLSEYDLVIIPSSFKPDTDDESISRAVYSWDRGWAYVRYGREICPGETNYINYFISAQHKFGQTALPSASPIRLFFADDDRKAHEKAVNAVFPDDSPVIVYNPTAANPFTRETFIEKEVDNTLSEADHIALIKYLRIHMPEYSILIGSALKQGDLINSTLIEHLRDSFLDETKVKSM